MKVVRVRGGAYADFLAGHLEYRAGNLDKALDWYRRALKSSESNPDILYEIANIQVKKGQLADARESLGRALAADPGHTRSRYLRAGVLAAWATGSRRSGSTSAWRRTTRATRRRTSTWPRCTPSRSRPPGRKRS